MKQEREELLEQESSGLWFASLWRYLLVGILVISLAVYVGLLLFGTNSIEALYELNVQKKSLERSILYLKKENARLQKEYFELKELEADE